MLLLKPFVSYILRIFRRKSDISWRDLFMAHLGRFLILFALPVLSSQFALAAEKTSSEGNPTVCSEFVENSYSKSLLGSQKSVIELIKIWLRQVLPDERQIQVARERIQHKQNPFPEGSSVVAQQLRVAADQILQKKSDIDWVELLEDFEAHTIGEENYQKESKQIDKKTAPLELVEKYSLSLKPVKDRTYKAMPYFYFSNSGEFFVQIHSAKWSDPFDGKSFQSHFFQWDLVDGALKPSEMPLSMIDELRSVPNRYMGDELGDETSGPQLDFNYQAASFTKEFVGYIKILNTVEDGTVKFLNFSTRIPSPNLGALLLYPAYFLRDSNNRIFLLVQIKDNQGKYLSLFELDTKLETLILLDSIPFNLKGDSQLHFVKTKESPLNIIGLLEGDELKVIQLPIN